MKKIFVILCCVTPLWLWLSIGHCEDLPYVPKSGSIPLTENRLNAIGEMINKPQFDFQKVIELLKEDEFEEAETMLNKRIATLKNMLENKWSMIDNQPKLVDCLTLSYFINIYLGSIKEAEADADYQINKLNVLYAQVLKNKLQDFVQEASQDKVKFGNMIKQMSLAIWASKDLKSSKQN